MFILNHKYSRYVFEESMDHEIKLIYVSSLIKLGDLHMYLIAL